MRPVIILSFPFLTSYIDSCDPQSSGSGNSLAEELADNVHNMEPNPLIAQIMATVQQAPESQEDDGRQEGIIAGGAYYHNPYTNQSMIGPISPLVSSNSLPDSPSIFEPLSSQNEAKNIVNSALEFYGFLTGMYGLLILLLNKTISYHFVLAWVALYGAIQVVRLYKSKSTEPLFLTLRQKRTRIVKMADWLLITSFIIGGIVRLEGIRFPLIAFVIPGYLNTLVYCFGCDLYSSVFKKKVMITLRILLWSQILMIALKADDYISNWAFVFVGLFYTLVFLMSVSVGFFILAFSYICQSFTITGYDYNFAALVWDFLNALFSWVWGFGLLGLIEELREEGGSTFLVPVMKTAVCHALLVALYTVCAKKKLTMYLMSTLRISSDEEEGTTENKEHTFATVKQNIPYLMKISPTYFMMVNKDFKVKDKAHTEECKKQIQEVKQQRKANNIRKLTLKNGLLKQNNVPEHKSATIRMETRKVRPKRDNPAEQGYDNTPGLRNEDLTNLCYSEDDADVLDEVQQKGSLRSLELDEHENNCVVCCLNAPNAVLMGCGHGGICYPCAIETWKSKDKCFLCRQPIDQILKVTLVNGVNVAKVIEGTKKYATIVEIADDA